MMKATLTLIFYTIKISTWAKVLILGKKSSKSHCFNVTIIIPPKEKQIILHVTYFMLELPR